MPSAAERQPGAVDSMDVVAELAAAVPWFPSSSQPAVVAVSGGADSIGLLLALVRLSRGGDGRLVVAHAEHDLRAEAPADREFVERMAASLGLPCVWRRLAVRSPHESSGEGLEGRARRLRYAFLTDVARESGARRVLVAHTADDQAETILHRVLRGTGVSGLGGMKRARPLCDGIALIRPLLGLSRAAVRAFVIEAGATWREDASNEDRSRARNFLRHEVLPRCAAGPYPSATTALVRLGGQAAGVAGALASAAQHLLDLHARQAADGSILLRTRELATLDGLLLAEVFVALWKREDWPRRDMTEAHFRRLAGLVDAAAAARPGALDLPGGVRATIAPGDAIVLQRDQSGISTRR